MDSAEVIAVALLAALCNRVRGGLGGDWIRWNLWAAWGTTCGRAVWSILPPVALALLTGDARLLALIPALFIGSVLGWYGSIDLGRNEGWAWLDWLIMAGRGFVWTAPAGFVLALIGLPWWPGLIGFACPLAYAVGWRIPSRIEDFQTGPPLGELLFGAMIGAGLAITTI